ARGVGKPPRVPEHRPDRPGVSPARPGTGAGIPRRDPRAAGRGRESARAQAVRHEETGPGRASDVRRRSYRLGDRADRQRRRMAARRLADATRALPKRKPCRPLETARPKALMGRYNDAAFKSKGTIL